MMRCHGNDLSRRGFLAAGAFGGLGLSLAELLMLQEARADQKTYDFIQAKAKSVIHIFLPGGMAQQESFDPKPYSPLEYRGEFRAIDAEMTGEHTAPSPEQVIRSAGEPTESGVCTLADGTTAYAF